MFIEVIILKLFWISDKYDHDGGYDDHHEDDYGYDDHHEDDYGYEDRHGYGHKGRVVKPI